MLKDSHYFEELSVKKSEEIRSLLDSRETRNKLEGMKRLIAMISIGRDASPYFPDVVKNVIAESLEVKKLVYMFLAHYAEQKSDVALLSINTFQKDLSDSNQLIRALALRVMTNIRVSIITQLQVLAIKKCIRDSSPYVRKAAAHAVAKVYSLDPEQKEVLTEIVGILMNDNSTMVVGSAVAAFIEVCPEQIDMIHANFRKFCRLCADTDEWGQMLVINMLTRYGRAMFANPNKPKEPKPPKAKHYRLKSAKKARDEAEGKKSRSRREREKEKEKEKKKKKKDEMSLEAFYGDDSDDDDKKGKKGKNKKNKKGSDDDEEEEENAFKYDPLGGMSLEDATKHREEHADEWETDSEASDDDEDEEEIDDDEVELSNDHRLMLRSTEPLFRSRNSGVVLAVSTLFFYTAPRGQGIKVGKSLIRLMHQSRETSYVVLCNIATMVQQRPELFAPFVKEFFVKSTDPVFSALIKLDILTHLITPQNSTMILKEFQAYVRFSEPSLVAATIQAIGRCASRVPELSQNCMRGLMDIIKSNRNETVVAEGVVVIRNLLHKDPEGHVRIIRQLTSLLDSMKVPAARASIVWMIGEYHSLIPKVGPDALRILAKGFADEAPGVKLQILNLGAKLNLYNPEQCAALFRYVCNVAKFDLNYDIRDRCRLLRHVLLSDECPELTARAKQLLLSEKPTPSLTSPFLDRERYMLNTLSHLVNHEARGYQPLSDWPPEPSSDSLRDPLLYSTSGGGAGGAAGGSSPARAGGSSGSRKTGVDAFYSSSEKSDSDSDRSSRSSRSRSRSRSRSSSRSSRSRSSSASSRSSSRSSSESDSDRDRRKKKSSSRRRGSSSESGSDSDRSSDSSRSSSPDSRKKKSSSSSKKKDSKSKSRRRHSSSSSESESDSGSSRSPSPAPKGKKSAAVATAKSSSSASKSKKDDALIDLDDMAGFEEISGNTTTNNSANDNDGVLSPSSAAGGAGGLDSLLPEVTLSVRNLLHFANGGGLNIDYTFTRALSTIYSDKMTSLRLTLHNRTDYPLQNIRVSDMSQLEDGMELQPFADVVALAPQSQTSVNIYIDLNDKTSDVKFEISHAKGSYPVKLSAPPGELLRPFQLSLADFEKETTKLKGLQESASTFTTSNEEAIKTNLLTKVVQCANVAFIKSPPSDDESSISNNTFRFAGRTIKTSTPVFIVIVVNGGKVVCRCSSDATILTLRIAEQIKKALQE